MRFIIDATIFALAALALTSAAAKRTPTSSPVPDRLQSSVVTAADQAANSPALTLAFTKNTLGCQNVTRGDAKPKKDEVQAEQPSLDFDNYTAASGFKVSNTKISPPSQSCRTTRPKGGQGVSLEAVGAHIRDVLGDEGKIIR